MPSIATAMSSSATPSPRQAPADPAAARAPSKSFVSSLSSFWRSKTSGLASARLSTSATMSASNDSAASTSSSPPASHLVVLVHGLYGRPSDWNVIMERLEERTKEAGERWRVLPSRANRRRLTLDGIDTCASRLAAEVRQVVEEEKGLERISFVGHSMGGLIARAALEELLDDDGGGGAPRAKATTLAGGGEAPRSKATTLAGGGGAPRANATTLAGGGGAPSSKATTLAGGGEAPRAKATTLAGGLSPAHFVSIATPHLGCHADAESTAAFVAAASSSDASPSHHPALVPLVAWVASAAATVAGSVGGGRELASTVAPRLLEAASARAAASLGRTGAQFFLADGKGDDEKTEGQRSPPLLARLADPRGRAFGALAAFESRTAFANSSGDHLVGWANSSLRRPEELPRERLLAATAAEREGGATAATAEVAAASSDGKSWSLRRRATVVSGDRKGNGGGRGVVLDDGVAAAFDLAPSPRSSSSPTSPDPEGGGAAVDRMLSSLASLPWRRVDACFRGSRSYFLSHNHIQATHFFNAKVGFESADAIARALVENDEELLRRRRERGEGKERNR